MIVLDTTVLVYAVGTDHPFREPCRRLVEATESPAIDARTTVEVLQEFIHVRARGRDREDAIARGRSYLTLLGPLLVPDEGHLREAMTIYRTCSRIGMFDAVLAAVAIGAGASLVSADRGFGEVGGLDHVVPTSEAVARLVEAAAGGSISV